MARLIAKSALESVLPVVVDGARLSELDVGPITSIAPLRGQEDAVTKALRAQFPGPGESHALGDGRIIWAGRMTAFLVGVEAPDGIRTSAAVTDQTDGWAAMQIEGSLAEPTLARLVPLDLRAKAFPFGASARTMLGHVPCLIVRQADEVFEVFVPRSMCRTAVSDLATAMRSVAGRD